MPPDDSIRKPFHQQAEDITGNDFYPRYLAAKKSIDDRALNRRVWETLRQALARTAGCEPVKILEIGAGIGTMLERFVERGLLSGPATYVATDSDPGQLRAARRYLSRWAQKQSHALSWTAESHGRVRSPDTDITVVLKPASAQELADRPDELGPFHLLIAHAVLDLLDFAALLPRLLQRLQENGLAYLTCNFDGETIFLPQWDVENEIIRRYHASMETRLPGASRTGRKLLRFLQRPGLELLAAGRSDWNIQPREDGYSADEIFFLHTIIETIARELGKKDSPPRGLSAWARRRHQQVQDGELSFQARHLDFLTRRRSPLP